MENKEYTEVQKEVSEEELEKYWSIVSDTDENKPEKFKKEYQLKEAVEVLCNALRQDKNKAILKECLNKEWELPYHKNLYIKYMEASYTAFNNFLNLLISK